MISISYIYPELKENTRRSLLKGHYFEELKNFDLRACASNAKALAN